MEHPACSDAIVKVVLKSDPTKPPRKALFYMNGNTPVYTRHGTQIPLDDIESWERITHGKKGRLN